MTKRFGLIFAVLFLLVWSQNVFSATITKEFTFELPTGEASKSWEINVPLPANTEGIFVGREFKAIVNRPDTIFQVEKEILSETNYYAKGVFFKLASSTSQLPFLVKFHVTLLVGKTAIQDTPTIPAMIGWRIGKSLELELEWLGFGDKGKKFPISAKYFHYQLKDEASGNILTEQVMPVSIVGFQFPTKYMINQNVKYLLSVQLSNVSGKYSETVNFKIFVPSEIDKSKY